MSDQPASLIGAGNLPQKNYSESCLRFFVRNDSKSSNCSLATDTECFIENHQCYIVPAARHENKKDEEKIDIEGHDASVVDAMGIGSLDMHLVSSNMTRPQANTSAFVSYPLLPGDSVENAAASVAKDGGQQWRRTTQPNCYNQQQEEWESEDSYYLSLQRQHPTPGGSTGFTNQRTAVFSLQAAARQLYQPEDGDLEEAATQRPHVPGTQKVVGSTKADVCRSLEVTLRAREGEVKEAQEALDTMRTRLAEGREREKVLRNRLLVAEETCVLYQLYLERLMGLLRRRASDGWSAWTPKTKPLVTNSDLVDALGEVFRSADAATEGGCDSGVVTPPLPSRQLTNATLLKSSMLDSAVSECIELWRAEERRQHNRLKQTLQNAVNALIEEVAEKEAVMLSALKKVEKRVGECGTVTTKMLEKFAKDSRSRRKSVDSLEKEIKEISCEYTGLQKHWQRAQSEIHCLRDELQRKDADRESSMLIYRATECIDETRQCVRNAVRSAAYDIEQRMLEGNTLKEPFLQSIRVLALKMEAHAELARTMMAQERSKRADDSIDTALLRRTSCIDTDEMYRRVLGTPHSISRGMNWTHERSMVDATRGLKTTILDELAQLMKNLCQLLENNLKHMEKNTANITRSITGWESIITKKMNDIWDFMRGIFATSGLLPASLARLSIGGAATPSSCRSPLRHTKPVNTSSTTVGHFSHRGSVFSHGSANTQSLPLSSVSYSSCSAIPATAGGQLPDAAQVASSWRAPLAPLAPSHDVQKTPDARTRRNFDHLSPPSIAVSRTPTPPPLRLSSASSLFAGMAGTLPPAPRQGRHEDRLEAEGKREKEEEKKQTEENQRQIFLNSSFCRF